MKKGFLKKCLAMLILVTLITQISVPSIAFALTSGPTVPEATSFEPVDTTDMVNPLTGDFTYNVPLLEVPGPEGGYPLSLSYHAGIQPNEEASWVGLGWTLNPGAINRNVNGYADDFTDVNQVARDYWAGGSRSTFGISLGLPVGVSFGLSFSHDTYQGFGVGTSLGFGTMVAANIGINAQIGTSPFGDHYAAAGLSVASDKMGVQGLGVSAGVGISTNFESSSLNSGVGLSMMGQNMLDASISSSDSKVNLMVGGGGANVSNANAGKIQTSSSGFQFGIPLPGGFGIGLSYNYTRYWSDESANVLTNGSLYMPQRQTDQAYFDNRTEDIYRLKGPRTENQNQGGTFPSFDDYYVSAQGLSGNIRPYIYQSVLYSQNIRSNSGIIQLDMLQRSGIDANNMQYAGGVQFRFINDFSNSYRQSPNDLLGNAFEFSSPAYGNADGNYGYDQGSNRLAGSKSVEWFTNGDINDGSAKSKGFINTNSAGFTRMGLPGSLSSSKGASQIGGFMITNASGVTYHYALPAYSYNEFSKTATGDDSKFTAQTKSEPYAYTWFLTAITGPDYVDRNSNGTVDEEDWGYWVSYQYGKWTSKYNWRNPSEDYSADIENGYKSYSKGSKEVYYLDAIKTRTHTALFVKQMRADAKGNSNESGATGNYKPSQLCHPEFSGPNHEVEIVCGPYNYPTATLALKKILLFQNSNVLDIGAVRTIGTGYTEGHNGGNVIDIFDVSTTLESKCLRKIDFNYDYSLNKGLPNSYDETGVNTYTQNPVMPQDYLGKLTLLSVDFQGRGGEKLIPPTEFEYDLNSTLTENKGRVSITQVPTNKKGTIQLEQGSLFVPGDIITFSIGSVQYYCTILDKIGTACNVIFIKNQPSSTSGFVDAIKTKNPPYDKDAYDIWGMFKSDYQSFSNTNLSRITSKVSNLGTDVWSLRKIKTALGSEISINYEGDTYSKSVFNKNQSLVINSFTVSNATNNLFSLGIDNPGFNLNEVFQVGSKVNFLVFRRTWGDTFPSPYTYRIYNSNDYGGGVVESVGYNQINLRTTQGFGDILRTGTPNWENLTGNLSVTPSNISYGGGLRVKSIITEGIEGKKLGSFYSYKHALEDNDISSGVTSYEPIALDVNNYVDQYGDSNASGYRTTLSKDMDYLLKISRELPAPGVMYEYVTVQDKVVDNSGNSEPIAGKTMYQYRTLNSGMIGVKEYQYNNAYSVHKENLSIKNYTSQIGNLVRKVSYDKDGNKTMEVINHFINDNIVEKNFNTQVANFENLLGPYAYQGVVQERYADGRTFVYKDQQGVQYDSQAIITMSGRDSYPVIQTGTTQIDYKNGTKIKNENVGFDFYSGEITKSVVSDSYGNRFMSEVQPAYRIYNGMGPKINEYTVGPRKNMLTQEASSKVYKINSYNQLLNLVSATAQTWGQDIATQDQNGELTTYGQTNIWRKKAIYNWMPAGSSSNGLTDLNVFQDFHSGGSSNTSWKKVSETSLYNVYSNPLEEFDINHRYSANKIGYGNSKVILSGGGARYDEIAFSGAEDGLNVNGALTFSGNVKADGGNLSTATSHTGNYSLSIGASAKGFVYSVPIAKLDPNKRNYSVSVWVKPSNGNISGARLYYQLNGGAEVFNSPTFQKYAAGWYLLEMTIPASTIETGTLVVGTKNIGSDIMYADDFRFQPLDAVCSAYVYNDQGELSHILNNNNLFTKFEYDKSGRLSKSFKEVLGRSNIPLIKEFQYNYGKISQAH